MTNTKTKVPHKDYAMPQPNSVFEYKVKDIVAPRGWNINNASIPYSGGKVVRIVLYRRKKGVKK